jgi:hypothetical protein
MAFPPLTKTDLSQFSGRPETSFKPYVDEALRQAVLLFRIATHRTDFPVEQDGADLARNAILDMADWIYLQQAHRKVAASPFTSESIGSYSYSKQVQAVRRGDDTGVMWFDLAVRELAIESEDDRVVSGSIGVFERDLAMARELDGNKSWALGPADIEPGPWGGSYGAYRVPQG